MLKSIYIIGGKKEWLRVGLSTYISLCICLAALFCYNKIIMEWFIKLHRQIVEWEWYDEPKVFKVFLHCLLRANHKPAQWRGIQINTWEFITSLDKLAQETKLSVQNIRTVIKKLKSTWELTYEPHASYTIIKLNNYGNYQWTNTEVNKQLTNNQQTTNTQLTTDKNDNNKKNDNNIISKDITTEVEVYWNEEINNMQSIIKNTIESNAMIYKPWKYERPRIKNIITWKDFGEVCKKANMSREDFVVNIINVAARLKYTKPINNWADLYENYAAVYNKWLEMKKQILQPKRLIW